MKRLTAVIVCLVFTGVVLGKASAANLGVGVSKPEKINVNEEKKDALPVEEGKAEVVSGEKIAGGATAAKDVLPAGKTSEKVVLSGDLGCEAAAAYLKAASYAENNLTDAAEKAFGEVAKKYSGTWWAEISCVKLAKMKLKAGKNEEGIKLLEDFSVKYPESLLAEKADFNLSVAYVLNKDKEKAVEQLEKFIADYPSGANISEAKKLLKKAKKKS